MALAKYKHTLVAIGTTNPAGGVTRATLDVSSKLGGLVTMKITNGATGPTAQCEGRVLISHEETLPAAGSAGADWKTVWRFGGSTNSGAITEQPYTFGPEVRHLLVEFTGNTGQAVTVESIATTFDV